MDKEKRRIQSEQMKREHKERNLIGIAMLTGIWRGTVFINGVAHRKGVNVNLYKFRKMLKK